MQGQKKTLAPRQRTLQTPWLLSENHSAHQAETAHREYDQNQTKAHDAGADTKAGGPYQSGMRLATDAQTKFDRSDFNGARTDWENASKQMQQAFTMADAVKPVPAPPPAAPPPPAPAQNTATQTAAAQASAAQKAAAQKAEDERAIQTVLDRYKAAYEAKNLARIKSVFPGLGGNEEKATSENIRYAKTIGCNSTGTRIQISATTQLWLYSGSSRSSCDE